jgi:hypothetical protein
MACRGDAFAAIKALAMAGLLLPAAGLAQDKGRDPRLDYADKLIENSSAAQKVESSGHPEALQLREQARALFQRAVAAGQAGDQAAASEYLNQAIRSMQQAVKLSNPEEVTGPKQQADFKRIEASVAALADALGRISAEKGVQARTQPVIEQIGRLRSEAVALFDAGNPLDGRHKLDQAYQLLKVNIEGLRGGESLTRSLEFKSAEEEYHYEVDRNDTHQMLVKVFAEEKITNDATRARVRGFLDQALQLREQADRLGNSGSYEAGVEMLEQSTRELIKAIRSAGLYIPS